ncbi:MAG: NPCBM/NEW2 domain-containing protein [Gemmataceae bacterium]|nr:NPCBM/NEW2 domain-containing protein [Gemmataceae bacterium]
MIWLALLCGAEDAFIARTVEGKEVRGPLASLASGSGIGLGKGGRRKVAWADLATLRREGSKLPEMPADEHLVLAWGDRVPARDLRLDGERLSFSHPDLEKPSVALAGVALVWRTGPDRAGDPAAARRTLLAAKRKSDRVILRNGDGIEGTLSKLGDSVEVEQDGKKRSLPWAQVAAVALASEGAERPKGMVARVVVAPSDRSPGGRFALVSARADEDGLIGKTAFGATLRVPLERVELLERVAERIVPLSSLAPSAYRYYPYLDEAAKWSADGTAAGGDLRVGGSTWSEGMSLRAHSRTEWALAGAFKRFEALVGLDDREGKRGKAKLRVLGDGKEVAAHELAHSSGPARVSVSVEGTKALALEVLPNGAGPVRAVVDLVDARLLK